MNQTMKKNFPIVDDIYRSERYNMVWKLSIAFSFIFALLSALFYDSEPAAFAIYLCVFCVAIFSLFWLKFTGKYKLVFWAFIISATCLVIYSVNTLHHTLHYSDLLWMVNIVLFAYLGLSKWEALIFVLIHSVSLGYFSFFRVNTHINNLRPFDQVELIVTTIEIVFAFLVMAYLYHMNIRFQSFVQSELRKANNTLEQQNNEITTLLKEVHHRVKNNLQIVVSLLRIQQAELNSDELQSQFQEAVNRVMTISSIHEKLYQSKELSKLNFQEYIQILLDDFEALFEHKKTRIHFESEIESIDLESIVPLGLIVNELITNSIKHSAKTGDQFELNLEFKKLSRSTGQLIYDDGNEWTSDKNGFGLELIRILSDQLDGKSSKQGSKFIIDFQAEI